MMKSRKFIRIKNAIINVNLICHVYPKANNMIKVYMQGGCPTTTCLLLDISLDDFEQKLVELEEKDNAI